MIQRIQTVYLLLTSVFFFNYWFFGKQWYEKGFVIIIDSFGTIKYLRELLVSISYFPLFITLICMVSIFFFKKRKLQIIISKTALFLCIFMSIFTVFYFYNCLDYLLKIMPSIAYEFLMYAAIFNPFLCTIFVYLAIKSIKNDENLVSSFDRIR